MTDSQRSLTLFIILSLAVCLVGAAQYVQSSRIRTLETKLQQIQGVGRQPSDSTALPTAPISLTGAASKGNPGAQVAILVYTDFQCPFCGVFAKTILPEIERRYVDTSRVFLAVKHLPLESLHPHARAAARAVSEARLQAGDAAFFKLLELFYAEQNEEEAFGEARLRDYAKRLGLDAQRLVDATRDTRHDAVIDRDRALASAAGIEATPSFSINGYRLSGAQPIMAFRRVIRHALAERPAKRR